MTEWRGRNVADMMDVEVPRIVASSLRDSGLNASTMDPMTHFALAKTSTSDRGTSEKAWPKIWMYRVSIPVRPS